MTNYVRTSLSTRFASRATWFTISLLEIQNLVGLLSFMEKTRVAIVGMGTVGTGVARLLLDHGDRLARHAGRILWLEKATVRDLKKDRNINLPAGILTDDLSSILNDREIEVVAHLVGGRVVFVLRIREAAVRVRHH